MTPEILLQLANLGVPRRPGGAATASAEPVLADPATADHQLEGLLDRPITAAELPGLRRLQKAAARIAEAVLAGAPVDVTELTAVARGSTARLQLAVGDDGALREQLLWDDPSPAAGLARRLIGEVAALKPGRLRRCARPECELLFYDTTRSRTRRWHAEDPCGWRERQQQRRSRA